MNKRLFLQSSIATLMQPFGFLNQQALATSLPVSKRRLVLIELAGANDGLNTLVPFSNDHYYRLRPTLGLSPLDVLNLSDELAMHNGLRPLMRLWEDGDLAWVQGLGYPQPNRSHFKSIALWESAGDGRSPRADRGWMTHAIEHQMARKIRDPHGISLAGDMSIFASDSGRWMSIGNISQIQSNALSNLSATTIEHPTLALVQRRLQILDTTLTRLVDKLDEVPDIPQFDGGAFGEQLRQVAMFISAGIDTPVYRVRLDGFDTHEHQLGRHTQLLNELGVGLNSFARSLKLHGHWRDTLIMSYSEFGRRAAENHSAGTDHGTAAPHFVVGGAVNGGLYGVAPDLGQLIDGDPAHTMDYRALYHRVLTDGLGITSSPAPLATFSDKRLTGLFKTV